MPRALADITLSDARGNYILAINVSALVGKTPEWAAEMRQNLLADGWLPRAPFFLMAFPDRFYLWKDGPYSQGLVMPTYDIDPTPLLNPYYKQMGFASAPTYKAAFEMVLFSLFGQSGQREVLLRNGYKAPGLVESGLLEALAIRGINAEFAA